MQRKNNRYQRYKYRIRNPWNCSKKHSYIVRIKNKNYTTSHGCIFLSLGKRKIGNEITVFKSDKYGKEVFKAFDFRIELIAFLMLLFGIVLIHESL